MTSVRTATTSPGRGMEPDGNASLRATTATINQLGTCNTPVSPARRYTTLTWTRTGNSNDAVVRSSN